MTFFKKYSYNIVKLFINQVAISIFGLVLAIACGLAKNDTLKLVTSVFAILFYLFLNYSSTWELGFKEHISIKSGRLPYKPYNGLCIALLSSVPSFIPAVFVMIGSFVSDGGFFSKLGAIAGMVALWIQGMYTGILSFIKIGGQPANAYWVSYFLILLPGIIIGGLGYYLGINGIHYTKIMIEDTPEEIETKRMERENRKKN